MVGIAKALGYRPGGGDASDFGTPFENGIYDLEVSLADAQAQQSAAPDDTSVVAEIERLVAELAAAIGLAKPGTAPDDSWATVDLDINDDLVVDERDLQAAGRRRPRRTRGAAMTKSRPSSSACSWRSAPALAVGRPGLAVRSAARSGRTLGLDDAAALPRAGRNGEALSWRNAATGAMGSITPQRTTLTGRLLLPRL